MKLPDINVLFNAVHVGSPHHAAACKALEGALDSREGVGFAWLVLVGFIRIATQRGLLPMPLPVADALSLVDGWLTHPHARIVHPGQAHAGILGRLLLEAGQGGNLTNDAHIAALAIEHQAEVLTFDKDFARFSGLRYQLLA
ncbi:PIN domain-containing protein [Comamonadaceae bacterium OH2545_COT-014]|nr:PIN domain-containing protein [Comamonadaceae bacterium OH2545_COT-014]